MSYLRVLAAGILALLLTVATAALSRIPATFTPPTEAALRLSWRVEGAVVENCRQPTSEELAELPVHMRNPRACIGQIAPYLLSVRIDGAVLVTDTLEAAGARGDRPLTVLRDFSVAAGSHDLQVAFEALLPQGAVVAEGSVTGLAWAGTVTLEPRDVALLTLDGSGGALELRMP